MDELRKRLRMEERVQSVKEALLAIQWRDRCRSRTTHCKGCCTNLIKAVLVTFNLTFLVLGWLLLGFGVWLHIYQDNFYLSDLLQDHNHHALPYTDQRGPGVAALRASSNLDIESPTSSVSGGSLGSPNGPGDRLSGGDKSPMMPADNKPLYTFSNIPFVLIAVGGFLAGMSFLGCCGACAESVCFLVFYTLTTTFIIIVEIILGSTSSAIMNQISSRLLINMQHQVQADYNISAQRINMTSSVTSLDRITLAWNMLQMEMDCCGAVGPRDYMFSAWFNNTKDNTGSFVPGTCCSLVYEDPLRFELEDENLCQVEAIIVQQNTKHPITQLRTTGCHEIMIEWIRGYEHRFLSLLSLTILLQMLNLFFACALIRWVRKKHTDYSWCENDEFE